jgi:hypothetical protein
MFAHGATLVWGAPGEFAHADIFKRPMVGGPHEVGGAEAGPQRLLKWDYA